MYDKDIINTSDKFQYCYEFGMFSLGNMNYTDTGHGFEEKWRGCDKIKFYCDEKFCKILYHSLT